MLSMTNINNLNRAKMQNMKFLLLIHQIQNKTLRTLKSNKTISTLKNNQKNLYLGRKNKL